MGIFGIHKRIQKELDQGRTREEIFYELSTEKPTETVKFAYCLASIPHSPLRAKFLKTNGVLFLLLILIAGLSVATEWPINLQQSTLFIAIQFFIPLIFAYFVFHFHGGIYRLIALWFTVDFFESLLLVRFTTAVDLFSMFVVAVIVVVSLVISKKVFPNLRIFGPAQDSDGRYIL